VVLAKGVRSYQAQDNGTVSLTLRRAIEWLTEPDLKHRVGDAGPLMYIPDARCERTVKHEIAVVIGEIAIDDLIIHKLSAGFQNPPVIVVSQGNGEQTHWQFLQVDLPLSSLSFYNDKLIARFFNPTIKEYSFDKEYLKTDIWGNPETTIKEVPAKDIVTVEIEQVLPPVSVLPVEEVVTLGIPAWRVGENKGLPDPDIIKQLQEKIAQLELQLDRVEERLNTIGDEHDGHSLQHRYYVLKREMCELRLSVLLNQRKLARQGSLDREYLYTPDPEIAELGLQLNQLRIKRRIYDYIVGALAVSCSSHLTN
jgi:alpha-mannosidase